MKQRTLTDIEAGLSRRLRIWKGSRNTKLIYEALREARDNGIRLAASVAEDYDKYSSHPYLVSDCILGKLNVLKGRVRKNKAAQKLDTIISHIERKVDSIESMTRFLHGVSKFQRGKKR